MYIIYYRALAWYQAKVAAWPVDFELEPSECLWLVPGTEDE